MDTQYVYVYTNTYIIWFFVFSHYDCYFKCVLAILKPRRDSGNRVCMVEQPAVQLEAGVRKRPLKARRKRQYEKKSPQHRPTKPGKYH